MGVQQVEEASFQFLKTLSRNNNREWFNKHKIKYLSAKENIEDFADGLLQELQKHDQIETLSGKDSLFRIYKDLRFSKDKAPYNTHWSGSFKRATNKLRGGYYFKLQPGGSVLAGGFWGPAPPDMRRIRQDIDVNFKDWKKLLAGKILVSTFGELTGEKLSSAPRGYANDHPAIELLRYKQFLLRHELTDQEVCHPDFARKASDIYKKMRPFLDHMSEVLTTDGNGESIV